MGNVELDASLMTESEEYRFEFLPGRFCWGGFGGVTASRF